MLWIQNKVITITYVNHNFLHVIFICSCGSHAITENHILYIYMLVWKNILVWNWVTAPGAFTLHKAAVQEKLQSLSRPLSGSDEWGQWWCNPNSFPTSAVGSLGNICYQVSENARFSTKYLQTRSFYRASEVFSRQSGGNRGCSGVLFSTSYILLYVINKGRRVVCWHMNMYGFAHLSTLKASICITVNQKFVIWIIFKQSAILPLRTFWNTNFMLESTEIW